MNVEEIVRTSMDQLARDLQPTVPDPAAVRARVNRGRRDRSIAMVGLAAAAAVALVVGVTELRDRSTGSGPTNPPPIIGTDANAVWMMDGILHIGDQSYPQDKKIDTALVPVAGGAVFGARGGEIVYQPVDGPAQIIKIDGEEQPPPGGPLPLGPAADPDSTLVAVLRWSADDGRYDLFFYDTERGHQFSTGIPIGDETWDMTGDLNPFGDSPLAPIEWVGPADGDLTALIRNGQNLWRTDAKGNGAASGTPLGQTPLDATLTVYADAGTDGRLTFTTPNGKTLSSVDNVGPDGGLSHDGAYFAGYSTDPEQGGAIAIVDTHTGETRYIEPPNNTVPMVLSWSSGHTLMFRASDLASQPSGLVVACNADDLSCVNVAEVDDINQTVLPRI